MSFVEGMSLIVLLTDFCIHGNRIEVGHDSRGAHLSSLHSFAATKRVAHESVRLVNTSGVPRLTKFYTPLREPSQSLIAKIFSLVSTRRASQCNFLEAPELESALAFKGGATGGCRVVYRDYATLYFVFVVDGAESGLGILDLIQASSGENPTSVTRRLA